VNNPRLLPLGAIQRDEDMGFVTPPKKVTGDLGDDGICELLLSVSFCTITQGRRFAPFPLAKGYQASTTSPRRIIA
jgi:hypothetical protein